MKSLRLLALGAIALIGAQSTGAFAETFHNKYYSWGDFTSHHLVDKEHYAAAAEAMISEDKLELREYLDYEQREPCQFYQEVPNGFVRDGCNITPINAPVKRVFEIYFDHDSDIVVDEAHSALKKMAREIKAYKPNHVTVSGHTDTSGSATYNRALSKRRADAVSTILTDLGVSNKVITEKAKGQTDLAVKTGDGVRLHENRRVVIEFSR